MSGEVILNGFDSLVEKPVEKVRPSAVVPDPKSVTELDWVVVQIVSNADGTLTTLQELRGWWTGKNYYGVAEGKRYRTRVVTQVEQGEVVEYDTSTI
ncbi:hypothetical protein [Arthrobacter sp. NPDC058127]|uniref:hypothetical protein n=1 Tax=Arthrobacter sp. NPDC058127 TaxID=3346351 RepID=UPI0036E2EB86